MEDAIPRLRECIVCDGLGLVEGKPTKDDPTPEQVSCGACRGKGLVSFEPDHNVREMALRIGGLLDKGGGGAKILIANQNNGVGVADSQSFDKLMSSLDSALYGEGRGRGRVATPVPPVDGEMIE